MYIIMGATGHIGSVLAKLLLEQKAPVTALVRNAQKAALLKKLGAHIEVLDVLDTHRLHEVFKKGERLFLLNPNAPPHTNTVVEEQRTVDAILKALQGSGIRKVVAQSTYGAQPGRGIGDLSILFNMEQGLTRTGIPNSVIRAAYYMSNWDLSLEEARENGALYSFFPPGFKLPMVAPVDIANVAARLMLEPIEHTGLHYVEGPRHYSPANVAEAFTSELNRQVEAVEIPADKWTSTFKEMGYSTPAAASMAAMTATVIDPKSKLPASPERGNTTLQEYIHRLVHQPPAGVAG